MSFQIRRLSYDDPYKTCALCKWKIRPQTASDDLEVGDFHFVSPSEKERTYKIYEVCPCRKLVFVQFGNFIRKLFPTFLILKANHEEWQGIRKQLFARFKSHIAHALYKSLRQERMEALAKPTYEEYISDPRVIRWLTERLNEEARKYSCVDNFRAANIRRKSQVRRYKKARDNGCCGAFEKEVWCTVDGNRYIIGFNYGH